ncbi:MAG: dihydroorotate dehydrogenase, partial [Armatimonadota bacterium]|nr:dihydroorotate dehydrogenase [Armatimonadota bacterium]
VSCPNVHAGQRFGSEPRLTEELVAGVRRATRRPLIVKLTPNATDVTAVARAAAGAGADAFGCVNTLAGLAIDPGTRRPRLGAGLGGLSGPAIRPVAVRLTWEVARATGLPVIGMGGVLTAEHALEFLLVGAHAVGVASAVLVDAEAPRRITAGLATYLQQHGFSDIRQVVGAVEGLPDEAPGLALAAEGWSG